MNSNRSPLAEAVQADLRLACAHLLDAGVSPGTPGIPGADEAFAIGPLGHVLATTQAIEGLLEPALDELERVPSGRNEVFALSPIPRHGRAPRRPQDYLRRGNGLVPRLWETRQGSGEPSRAVLGWILHGIERLEERIEEQRSGHDRSFDEAARFRGGSRYGREEVEHLRQQSQALLSGEDACRRWKRRIAARSGVRIRSTPRLPHPFPRTSHWRSLRSLILGLERPESILPRLIAHGLQGETRPADLPYLYERWCGWRLLQGMESLGWFATQDPIPTLLYGGAVDLEGEGTQARLLCFPRFVADKDPIEGIVPRFKEASPDYVLLVQGPGGCEASVLDPTLSVDLASRKSKWNYLDTLQLLETRRVAGVVTRKAPLRSWAAAPLIHGKCIDVDWRGGHGTIPMNPCAFEAQPILDWLAEVLPVPRTPPVAEGGPRESAGLGFPTGSTVDP